MITATTDPTKQRYNSGILKDTIPKIDQCIVANIKPNLCLVNLLSLEVELSMSSWNILSFWYYVI
jgi:hypothetical protein